MPLTCPIEYPEGDLQKMTNVGSLFFADKLRMTLNPCFQIILMNFLLIYLEFFILKVSSRIIIVSLALNYCLALAIILNWHKSEKSSDSVISNIDKKNDCYASEFLKISGNLSLIIAVSLIAEQYIPFKTVWEIPLICILSVLIALRWNSSGFLNHFFELISRFFDLKLEKSVSFKEILAADIWTSFSKPLSQLISSNYLVIKLLIYR